MWLRQTPATRCSPPLAISDQPTLANGIHLRPGSSIALHRIGWLVLALWALCWCGSSQAGGASPGSGKPAAAEEAIDAITLQHGCFGCDASVLVLRRDGSATLTMTGNARHGTQDRVLRGHLSTGEFSRLAQAVVAQGFFTLNDSYEDPSIRDGAWTSTTVARGTESKLVFSRDDAAPPALSALTVAIEAVQRAITFAP